MTEDEIWTRARSLWSEIGMTKGGLAVHCSICAVAKLAVALAASYAQGATR